MTGNKYIAIAAALLLGTGATAQDNGKKNIEKLCGCFSVNFRYAETFSPNPDYKYHDREEMNATELALPIENTDNKVVIQHLLVIHDTMVIKHWREEWEYQSPVLYTYAGDKVWNKMPLTTADAKGKWTQTVWEVNDEPRYQGMSAWVSNNGKTYWESTADAPLPRREYTTRSDYNIMRRNNRIIITDKGYTHEQDNEKINRTDAGDKEIAQEKGFNTYYKMDESECAAAKTWWKKNEAFWSVVRSSWDKHLAGAKTIAVKATADDKPLSDHFTALYKDWKANKITDAQLPVKVDEIITKFL